MLEARAAARPLEQSRSGAISLALALCVLASPLAARPAHAAAPLDPGSLVPARVEWALLAPRAGPASEEALALLRVTGARAPLLRASSLGRQLTRAVGISLLDPQALAAFGYDPAAPLALASLDGSQLLSIGVKDREAAEQQLASWLSEIGLTRSTVEYRGRKLFVARAGASNVAAYVLLPDRAISARMVENAGDARSAVQAALDALAGKKAVAGQQRYRSISSGPEPWRFFGTIPGSSGRSGALALRFVAPDTLGLRGQVTSGAGGLLGTGGAGFPGLSLPGNLLVARAVVSPKALAPGGPLRGAVAWLVDNACRRCGKEVTDALAAKLGKLLAGPVALVVSRLDVEAVTRTGGRLDVSAFPHLYGLKVKDRAAAEALLAGLATTLSATASPGEGKNFRAGSALFGLRGDVLFVGNDEAIRDRALPALALAAAAIPAGAAAAPGAVAAEPAVLGKALAGLGMGDMFGGSTLAVLFGLKVELGPLLDASGPILGEVRPAGSEGYAVDLTWDLVR